MDKQVQEKKAKEARQRQQLMTTALEQLEGGIISQDEYNAIATEAGRDLSACERLVSKKIHLMLEKSNDNAGNEQPIDDGGNPEFTDDERRVIERYEAAKQGRTTRRSDGEMGRGGNGGQNQS